MSYSAGSQAVDQLYRGPAKLTEVPKGGIVVGPG